MPQSPPSGTNQLIMLGQGGGLDPLARSLVCKLCENDFVCGPLSPHRPWTLENDKKTQEIRTGAFNGLRVTIYKNLSTTAGQAPPPASANDFWSSWTTNLVHPGEGGFTGRRLPACLPFLGR